MDKIEKINKKDIFKTGNIFEGNIADHVKFHFNEATDSSAAENGKTEQNELINPKIVELFQLIGRALKQLHQGNLPKAMKAVPNLTNWEEIIDIANPFEWTPYAVQSVTKMFASNLKSEMAETFYKKYLLPICRENILKNKKLDFRLFLALKKATYKPAAFYKGILVPLLNNDCTKSEAKVLSSIILKSSIPVLHSAAAIILILRIPTSKSQLLILKTLLNKKYSLPISVIKKTIDYFVSFKSNQDQLPLIWHQCLLVLVQTYKTSFDDEQKSMLQTLVTKQKYKGISNEIIAQIKQN